MPLLLRVSSSFQLTVKEIKLLDYLSFIATLSKQLRGEESFGTTFLCTGLSFNNLKKKTFAEINFLLWLKNQQFLVVDTLVTPMVVLKLSFSQNMQTKTFTLKSCARFHSPFHLSYHHSIYKELQASKH